MQRAMAVKDVRSEKEVRLITAGLKKPATFTPSTMTIRQFIFVYEAYVEAMGMTETAAIKGFISFLDAKSVERLTHAVGSLDKSSWDAYKQSVCSILEDSSKYNTLSARFNLRNIKQKVGETVHEFGERLRDLGNIGFPEIDAPSVASREAALKDALAAGITNDDIGIKLITSIADKTFDEMLKTAITLDISHQARSTIRAREDNVEVSVLRAEWNREEENPRQFNRPRNDYRGAQENEHHQSRDRFAPVRQHDRQRNRPQNNQTNLECWFCGKRGHLKRDCRALQRYTRGSGATTANSTRRDYRSQGHDDRFTRPSPRTLGFDQYPDNFAPGSSRHREQTPQRRVHWVGAQNPSTDGTAAAPANNTPAVEGAITNSAGEGENTTPVRLAIKPSAGVFVRIRIGDEPSDALVDTGACVNILSYSLVNKAKLLADIQPCDWNLVGVSGTPMKCAGKLDRITLELGTQHLEADFVVANIQEQLILGQPMLVEHGCVLDLDNASLCVKGNHTPLIVRSPTQERKHTYKICVAEDTKVSKESNGIPYTLIGDTGQSEEGLYYTSEVNPVMGLFGITEGDILPLHPEKGRGILPCMITQGLTQLELPKGYEIGTCTPAIYCTRVETLHSSEDRDDFDPERVKEIISTVGIDTNSDIDDDTKVKVKELLTEFADVFALGRHELRWTPLTQHEINLSTSTPVRLPYRRIPLHLRDDCITELESLLKAGIIEHSESSYNSPAIVLRKGPGKVRIVLDYRVLNSITVRSYCTVPALNTMTAGCSGANWFSTLDLGDAFLQVPLKPEHRHYTAFSISGVGFFQYRSMPLGLSGSPGTFQNLLDRVLAGVPPSVAAAFIDDILCPAKTTEDMISHLRVVFGRIRPSKLRLSPKKCILFQKRIKYCGVYLTTKGIEADTEKISAIRNMTPPRTFKQLRALIGCYSWFRTAVENFSEKAAGLTNCLKQTDKFVLTDEAMESIQLLNEALTSPPVLIYPSTEKELFVFTDASLKGIGGTIGHMEGNTFKPIAYSSKILNQTEQNWPSYKREFHALWFHITKQWRYYLLGAKFTAYVDMKALTDTGFLRKTNEAIMTRWIMDLSDYTFDLKYKSGALMQVPDCLSRLPQTSDELYPWWDRTTPSSREKTEKGKTVTCKTVELSVDTKIITCGEANPTPTAPPKHRTGEYESPLRAHFSAHFAAAQAKDTDIATAKQWLLADQKERDEVKTAAFSDTLLKMWMLFPHLCLSQEGLVCYKYFAGGSKKYRELIYVPHTERKTLIASHHDNESAGHLGPKKTLLRVREKYYFEGMTTAVKIYCATCATCFPHNEVYRRNPAAPLKPFLACRPNQILCIDLVGPIRGGRMSWILCMTDKFTRLCQAKPLPNASATQIAKCLLTHWVTIYGVPETIHSDRGANLHVATVIVELYRLLGVKKTATTSYHPSGNGAVENLNKTIVVIVKKLVGEFPQSWFEKLSYAVFALNSSVNGSTRFTPHQLYFGRELRLPYDLAFDTTTTAYYETGAHLLSEQRESMRDTLDLVRANGISAMQRQKLAYDKKRGFHTTYTVGEKALVWKPLPVTVRDYRKFRTKFSGPWTVNKVLSEWTYQLKNDNTGKLVVTHFDSLRKIPKSLRTKTREKITPEQGLNQPTIEECDDTGEEEDDGLHDLFYHQTTLQKTQGDHPVGDPEEPLPNEEQGPTTGPEEPQADQGEHTATASPGVPNVSATPTDEDQDPDPHEPEEELEWDDYTTTGVVPGDESFASAIDELEEEEPEPDKGPYNLRRERKAPERYEG
eukprot:sb/3460671/